MEPFMHSHAESSCKCDSENSTRQTLAELDFERGIWFAGVLKRFNFIKFCYTIKSNCLSFFFAL